METDTPVGWLERASASTPGAPALISSGGIVSYAELDERVGRRAKTLAAESIRGRAVPVATRVDTESIVEVLAVLSAGGVVVPHAGSPPEIQGAVPPGTVLCIATSGSRGAARLVPLTGANLSAAVTASKLRLGNGPSDRWLATLPLHHIGGLSVVFRSIEAGGAVVVGPFGDDTVDLVARTRPTIASLVPTMVYRMLEQNPDALSFVGTILVGGARLGPGLYRRCVESGLVLTPTYGMTEASSQIATAVPGSLWDGGEAVGPVLDGFTVSIRAGTGPAAPGEVGVIEVDGPAVFGGYVGEPPRRGPHVTSDIGYIHHGVLSVIGRIDDVVVTGGENVSLTKVSDAIAAVTGVREVAVVGSPDPEWGTAVCALVELDETISIRDVTEELVGSLPPHAVPRYLESGTVPLLNNGKHDIAAVRRHFDER